MSESENQSWRETVSLVIDGKSSELIEREDLNPRHVFGAVSFGLYYSRHDDSKAKGYLSTTQARAILTAWDADIPDAGAALLECMEPHECRPDRKAARWPINKGHDQASADFAWVLVLGIERGWFQHDRAGFLQWTQAGRDRFAAGRNGVLIESATGQAAFAF